VSLEKAAAAGLLSNTEVWLFTNNTTAEAAYFRGSSKSRQLHGLVLRLRLLEMSSASSSGLFMCQEKE
jgi:hypothetical protein